MGQAQSLFVLLPWETRDWALCEENSFAGGSWCWRPRNPRAPKVPTQLRQGLRSDTPQGGRRGLGSGLLCDNLGSQNSLTHLHGSKAAAQDEHKGPLLPPGPATTPRAAFTQGFSQGTPTAQVRGCEDTCKVRRARGVTNLHQEVSALGTVSLRSPLLGPQTVQPKGAARTNPDARALHGSSV